MQISPIFVLAKKPAFLRFGGLFLFGKDRAGRGRRDGTGRYFGEGETQTLEGVEE